MSFLDLFFRPSAQKLEQKGDALFDAGLWAQAKQTYERSLDKLDTHEGNPPADYLRITEKIRQVKDSLARELQLNAENYLEGGYWVEARELIVLALDFTSDEQVKKELEQKLAEIDLKEHRNIPENTDDFYDGFDEEFDDINEDDDHEKWQELSENEEFVALCNTLPDEVCAAYHSYGPNFKTGYVALNQGDFQSAIDNFKVAIRENPQPDTFISLELATAYWNLDQTDKAQMLLEDFISYHPEALPAYQLLCEIYWDRKNFSKVDDLLASIPPGLKESLAVVLLQGETLYQSGKYQEAKIFYTNFIKTYGSHKAIMQKLAETCETLGESDLARKVYKELIGGCNDCKTRIDPEIKDRYAELSFAAGSYSVDILEMYLSLAGERPEEAARYFDRISRIYEAQGNLFEAARFRAFSKRAQKELIDEN